MPDNPRSLFHRLETACFWTALTASAACAISWTTQRDTFAHAYLISFLFWSGILLGSMAVQMIHNITGGRWGTSIRPILEVTARHIPWLILCFVPIVFCLQDLYVWMDPSVVQHDPLLKEKAFYLNRPFFTFRGIFYFVVWTAMAFLVTGSVRVSPDVLDRRKQASGFGLVVLTLTVTFSSVDWAMSLEPHWNSTIYGLILVIGMTLSGFAFAVLLAHARHLTSPKHRIPTEQSHDLGTVMFVFVMLWAYVSLSQFLIIWSGNLPELTPFYITRFSGGWQSIGVFLAVFHFAVPFLLLLMRPIKKNPRALLLIAAWLLGMRWVDLFWYLRPATSPTLTLHLADLASFLAVGGSLLWMISKKLARLDHDQTGA